jgi:hypothetical protein
VSVGGAAPMAQNDQSRMRAKAWDNDAARQRAGTMLPAGLAERTAWLGRLLSQWAIAEVAPGRLLPWLPVAFGFGIVLYFTADREPAWWAASALALAGVIVAFLARRRAFGFAIALGFAAIAAGDGVKCDAAGCIGRLFDGRLVSKALSAEAFAEDCAHAAVVVSSREAPGDCAALLIDRKAWRADGAIALRWTGNRFELSAARPARYERPWAPAPHEPASTAQAPTRPAASDATPLVEDMEPGD